MRRLDQIATDVCNKLSTNTHGFRAQYYLGYDHWWYNLIPKNMYAIQMYMCICVYIYLYYAYMQLVTQMYLHLFRSALQITTTVSHEKTALLYFKVSVWCQTRLFSVTGLMLSSGSPYTSHWCCFVSENARVLVLSSKIVEGVLHLKFAFISFHGRAISTI